MEYKVIHVLRYIFRSFLITILQKHMPVMPNIQKEMQDAHQKKLAAKNK